MRLSERERAIVRAAVRKRFGAEAKVLLFGSRVDDSRRGGDIDLLVDLPRAPDDPMGEAVALEIEVMRGLGERKVDVLIAYPGMTERPIHRIARRSGLPV
jgi:predicted nucleotidyltransferase